jgi:hypothetical protein
MTLTKIYVQIFSKQSVNVQLVSLLYKKSPTVLFLLLLPFLFCYLELHLFAMLIKSFVLNILYILEASLGFNYYSIDSHVRL